MNILLIHNRYKEAGGGEDAVFRAESELLSQYQHKVDHLIFDNNEIKTSVDRFVAGFKLIYNPNSANILKKKIAEFRPDVIHVHNFVPIASPSIFFVARRHGIPVILTLHNYRLICPSTMLYHNKRIYERSIRALLPLDAILKGVYGDSRMQTAAVVVMTALHSFIGTWRNKIDQYIALTEFARNKFAGSALSIPSEKLRVKPNFVFDHGPGPEVRKEFFLFVGRLCEYKGIPTLLEAARRSKCKLVIIGDGPMRQEVVDFARGNPDVTYLGFQEPSVVMNYIKMCKALIFPSKVYEGFPITILQAFSAGTIVVASRLGGMAEIIQSGVNGFHFEVENVDDLISRMREISAGPEYLRSVAANARLSYCELYTPEKNYTLLMNIYACALSLRSKSRTKLVTEGLQQLSAEGISNRTVSG